MNILIISFDADPPYMGGTATVAHVLAKAFHAKGYFCALGYMETSDHPSTYFHNKVKLVKENISVVEKFFNEHKFDIILDQLANITDFEFLLSLPLGGCKIISAYHNRPMLHPIRIDQLLNIYKSSNHPFYKIYTLAKIPLLPFIKFIGIRNELKSFKNIYLNSDKILLLSEKFFKNWLNLVPETNINRLVAIGNPLVFDKSFPAKEIGTKEKLVIAVCSANSQKRAHLLIKIWARIEKDVQLNDWTFEFVGGGEEIENIKKLAKNLELKRIKFVGYKDPLPFYQRASIMIMTPKYEGWPMVLMEGQQMGVIPISYNSYESITDIIDNGENGLIIPNNNMKCFVEKMKALMKNQTDRERIILNCIHSSLRFSIAKVVKKYTDLFLELQDAK